MRLLGESSIQDELKLSREQVQQIAHLYDMRRDAFRNIEGRTAEQNGAKFDELAKDEKGLLQALKDEQRTRLHSAVGDVIDRYGGRVDVIYDVELYLSRRA